MVLLEWVTFTDELFRPAFITLMVLIVLIRMNRNTRALLLELYQLRYEGAISK